MRSKLLVLLLILFCLQVQAQSEFPLAWKADHGFKAKLRTCNNETSLFFGANDEQASMIDGSGKNLWKISVDKFGLKEAECYWICKPNVVILHQAATKKAGSVTVFIDGKTGNELWRTTGISGFGFDNDKFVKDSYLENINGLLVKKFQKLQMVDVSTGRIIWENNSFVDRKMKSFDCDYSESTNLLSVIVDDKEYNYVDLTDGTLVDRITPKYYKTKQSGAAKKGKTLTNLVDESADIAVSVNYKLDVLFFSNTKNIPVTLTGRRYSTGDVLWTTALDAKVVLAIGEQKYVLNAFMENGHVFVVYEGISVFDAKTGKPQWKSDFNNSEIDGGLKTTKQVLDISAFPLVDGNSVYIVDLTKETYGIKKLDANTGNIIWKTEKFSSSDIIPNIKLVNGVLLAQFGGVVDYQTTVNTDNGVRHTSTYKYRGNPGIKAFDPNTGKTIWDEKKLGEKKLGNTSNFIFDESLVYFMTENNFYALNIADGAIQKKVDLKDLKMGEPLQFELNKDSRKVNVLMEKGICAIDLDKNAVAYKTVVKDVTGWFTRGDNYFLLIGDDQDAFVGIDINTGAVRGKHKGEIERISADGKYIVEFDGGKVQKFNVL
jgi:hypothetical protein